MPAGRCVAGTRGAAYRVISLARGCQGRLHTWCARVNARVCPASAAAAARHGQDTCVHFHGTADAPRCGPHCTLPLNMLCCLCAGADFRRAVFDYRPTEQPQAQLCKTGGCLCLCALWAACCSHRLLWLPASAPAAFAVLVVGKCLQNDDRRRVR